MSYLFLYLNDTILAILVLFVFFFGVKILQYFIAKTNKEEPGVPTSKIQELVLDSIKEVQQTLVDQQTTNQQRICVENADKIKDVVIDTVAHSLVNISEKEEQNISQIEEVKVDSFLGGQAF